MCCVRALLIVLWLCVLCGCVFGSLACVVVGELAVCSLIVDWLCVLLLSCDMRVAVLLCECVLLCCVVM